MCSVIRITKRFCAFFSNTKKSNGLSLLEIVTPRLSLNYVSYPKQNNVSKAVTQLLSRLTIFVDYKLEWHSTFTEFHLLQEYLHPYLVALDMTTLFTWHLVKADDYKKKGSLQGSSGKGTQGEELIFELATSQS